MPATVNTAGREIYADGHEAVTEIELSALQEGELDNFAHGGPAGVAPYKVELEVRTAPTDNQSNVQMYVEALDTTNDEVDLRFTTTPGGSLAGAIVRVRCYFKAMASGGLGNTYTTPVV